VVSGGEQVFCQFWGDLRHACLYAGCYEFDCVHFYHPVCLLCCWRYYRDEVCTCNGRAVGEFLGILCGGDAWKKTGCGILNRAKCFKNRGLFVGKLWENFCGVEYKPRFVLRFNESQAEPDLPFLETKPA
jgi:hypothetical protein